MVLLLLEDQSAGKHGWRQRKIGDKRGGGVVSEPCLSPGDNQTIGNNLNKRPLCALRVQKGKGRILLAKENKPGRNLFTCKIDDIEC